MIQPDLKLFEFYERAGKYLVAINGAAALACLALLPQVWEIALLRSLAAASLRSFAMGSLFAISGMIVMSSAMVNHCWVGKKKEAKPTKGVLIAIFLGIAAYFGASVFFFLAIGRMAANGFA